MGIEIEGKRIVVVGASAGIGRAIGVHAVRAGARVVFAARRAEALEAAIAEAGGGTSVVADTTDADDCRRLAASAADELGGIDLLLYATGMSPLAPLSAISADDWMRVLATNVVGASTVTAACLPHLAADAIVGYFSSDSAHRPRHGLVPYAASKAALEETIAGWRVEHPDRRFVKIVVGPTMGTEFGVGFDPELVAETFPIWLAHADIQIGIMDLDEMVDVLLTSLGAALSRPTVELQEITLRPPGPLAASIDEMLALHADSID